LWIFPQCSWWEHPGHMTWDTANVLAISWPRHTAVTLTGNILNGLGMYQVGFCLVLHPCPCDGLVMYEPRPPPLAPSVIRNASIGDCYLGHIGTAALLLSYCFIISMSSMSTYSTPNRQHLPHVRIDPLPLLIFSLVGQVDPSTALPPTIIFHCDH